MGTNRKGLTTLLFEILSTAVSVGVALHSILHLSNPFPAHAHPHKYIVCWMSLITGKGSPTYDYVCQSGPEPVWFAHRATLDLSEAVKDGKGGSPKSVKQFSKFLAASQHSPTCGLWHSGPPTPSEAVAQFLPVPWFLQPRRDSRSAFACPMNSHCRCMHKRPPTRTSSTESRQRVQCGLTSGGLRYA